MFSISGKAGFGLKMLCASVALVMVAKVATVAAEDTFPACDGDNLNKLAWEDEIPGQGEKWVIDTQGDIQFVAPGLGACGWNYTDASNVVCVNPGWLGYASKGSKCGQWVNIEYQGRQAQAIMADSCPGVSCNDLWLTKSLFQFFGGDTDKGHLNGTLKWSFLEKEPFWACLGGIPTEGDDCEGEDDFGCPRDGRRCEKTKVVGEAAYDACPNFPNPYQMQHDGHKMPAEQTCGQSAGSGSS